MRCNLSSQTPPCKWAAALCQTKTGWDLRGLPDQATSCHAEDAPTQTRKRGIKTLELRREFESSFCATIRVAPRQVHRAHLLKPDTDVAKADDVDLLKQVQWVKKSLRKDLNFGVDYGDFYTDPGARSRPWQTATPDVAFSFATWAPGDVGRFPWTGFSS